MWRHRHSLHEPVGVAHCPGDAHSSEMAAALSRLSAAALGLKTAVKMNAGQWVGWISSVNQLWECLVHLVDIPC